MFPRRSSIAFPWWTLTSNLMTASRSKAAVFGLLLHRICKASGGVRFPGWLRDLGNARVSILVYRHVHSRTISIAWYEVAGMRLFIYRRYCKWNVTSSDDMGAMHTRPRILGPTPGPQFPLAPTPVGGRSSSARPSRVTVYHISGWDASLSNDSSPRSSGRPAEELLSSVFRWLRDFEDIKKAYREAAVRRDVV